MRILSCALIALALAGCSGADKPTYSCPDWSESSTQNYSNADFSNFGCAYYNNIQAQLLYPDDYEKGYGVPAITGDRETINLQKYFTATPQTVNAQSVSGGSR